MTSLAFKPGNLDRTRAAAADTKAAEALVPVPIAYPLLDVKLAPTISVAGAASTTSFPWTDASTKLPFWSVPETASTPGQFAGEMTPVSPWVVLPAEATT